MQPLTRLPLLPGARQVAANVQVFGLPGAALGDKVRMLVEHAPAIAAAGFLTPPRIVLAENLMSAVIRYNDRGDDVHHFDTSLQWMDSDFKMPSDIEAMIASASHAIREAYGEVPVVVRSSGMGDARGIGVYQSYAEHNDPKRIGHRLSEVLASYLAPHAAVWRKKTGVPTGFAAFLEPMVSQSLPLDDADGNVRYVAPLLSGMGYSSTGIDSGFIKFGYGMRQGSGARLTRASLAGFNFSARRYLEAQGEEARFLVSMIYGHPFERRKGPVSFSARLLATMVEGVSLKPLFDGLRALESRIGQPVYAEWAIHAAAGRQHTYLNQLALVPPQKEKWEFDIADEDASLLKLRDVRRGQDLDIGALVHVDDLSLLDHLAAFNAVNSAYLLIYGRNVMGSVGMRQECPLTMQHISNASALMLAPYVAAPPDWEEHLHGLAESAGIMIGRGNYWDRKPFQRSLLHFGEEHGIAVYRRPMRLHYSSSRQDAMVTAR